MLARLGEHKVNLQDNLSLITSHEFILSNVELDLNKSVQLVSQSYYVFVCNDCPTFRPINPYSVPQRNET